MSLRRRIAYSIAILAAAVLVAATPDVAVAQGVRLAEGLEVHPDSNTNRVYPELRAEWPAPALVFGLGEIQGLRDIQGGQIVPGYPQLNALAIGAGNGDNPGELGLGADVTRTIHFSARLPAQPPRRLAVMSPQGTTFTAPVTFEGPVYGLERQVDRRLVRRLAARIAHRMMRRHLARFHGR